MIRALIPEYRTKYLYIGPDFSDMSTEKRVTIRTSVPEYQKEAWVEHADDLDMSQSEFLATMIQAGRRVFEEDLLETRSADANPRGNGLETYILELLSTETSRSFDELVDTTADELDAVLQSLTHAGSVRFSGRNGGYTLVEENHGND
jgi:hypothetical protein